MKLISAFIFIAASIFAQADKPADTTNFYRLDLVVKEVEGGKVINSRAYSMEISDAPQRTGENSSLRTGSKFPVMGKDGSSFTYVDLGINFDCRSAREIGNQLSLNVQVDISSLAELANPPTIRNTKWGSNVMVLLRKPTIVFSSDDVVSKRQMQLELTATPIK